jgi:hypothetical protein
MRRLKIISVVAGSLMILAMCVGAWLPHSSDSQTTQCWSIVNGIWTYNQSCSAPTLTPWGITSGKTFTVLNTLTLEGIDNQIVDFHNLGQGTVSLGTAALQPSSAFQPAGSVSLLTATYGSALTPATGALSISVSAGLAFAPGMLLTITDTTVGSVRWMYGTVTTYNVTTGALVMSITQSNGSGSSSSWVVSASGPPGPVSQVTVGSLAMTGEANSYAPGSVTASLNLGSVTVGDRIFVQAYANAQLGTAPQSLSITQTAGSSSGAPVQGGSVSGMTMYSPTTYSFMSGVWQVTGSGTLTLTATQSGGGTPNNTGIYAFFLKKQ